MKQIRIKSESIMGDWGHAARGDLVRCDDALAEHLVKAGAAEYVAPPAAAPARPSPASTQASKRPAERAASDK